MTLNDLERRNSPYFAFFRRFRFFCWPAGQLAHRLAASALLLRMLYSFFFSLSFLTFPLLLRGNKRFATRSDFSGFQLICPASGHDPRQDAYVPDGNVFAQLFAAVQPVAHLCSAYYRAA